MQARDRTNAIWLAQNWTVVTTDLPPDLTHPQNTQAAHRGLPSSDNLNTTAVHPTLIRSDAMWLAENWASLSHGDTTLTHPRRIREEHRDLQASLPPSPDLDLSEAVPTLNPVDVLPIAKKVMKLAARAAESGRITRSSTRVASPCGYFH